MSRISMSRADLQQVKEAFTNGVKEVADRYGVAITANVNLDDIEFDIVDPREQTEPAFEAESEQLEVLADESAAAAQDEEAANV